MVYVSNVVLRLSSSSSSSSSSYSSSSSSSSFASQWWEWGEGGVVIIKKCISIYCVYYIWQPNALDNTYITVVK